MFRSSLTRTLRVSEVSLNSLYFPLNARLWNILKLRRNCHSSEISEKKLKPSVTMSPNVQSLFDDQGLKYRKHPGKQPKAPLTLPEKLLEIVDILLADLDHTELQIKKKELDNYLYSRRLPIESLELQKRTADAMEKFNISEDMLYADDEYSKKKVRMLQKQLRYEINRWRPINNSKYSCLVYMVSRLAGNYASTYKVLSELKSLIPNFEPKSYFDFGMGVGSSLWAVNTIWESSIKEYFCVDTSSDMHDLCQRILQGGKEDAPMLMQKVYFRQFLPTSSEYTYDLIISSFSLTELPSAKERLQVIDILWRKTRDVLIFIENGSLAGFSAVLEARDYLLKLEEEYNKEKPNIHVVSPCPHREPCPKFGSRLPCTAPVRYHPFYPKNDSNSVKKELFSYVVLRKGQKDSNMEEWPRIVQQVSKKSNMAFCRLCCSDGKIHDVVFTKSKHARPVYNCAKNCLLGDRLPVTIKEVHDATEKEVDNTTDKEMHQNIAAKFE